MASLCGCLVHPLDVSQGTIKVPAVQVVVAVLRQAISQANKAVLHQ